MRDEEFEWDDAKAAINFKKHKVGFETASRAFDDINAIHGDDLTSSWGEDRHFCTGLVDGTLFTVVYAYRDDRIRIISAWRSTRREVDDYYSGEGTS